NIILSGSEDKSIRLWDMRTGQQIKKFKGHTFAVWAVEYSPFIIKNNNDIIGSNVICSGSGDNTIRFWDSRSNKNQLYMIRGDDKQHDNAITCIRFVSSKKKK
ncbi:hypothetical protein RFI_26425, partial [Reticulomyxa filosa]